MLRERKWRLAKIEEMKQELNRRKEAQRLKDFWQRLADHTAAKERDRPAYEAAAADLHDVTQVSLVLGDVVRRIVEHDQHGSFFFVCPGCHRCHACQRCNRCHRCWGCLRY